ncbi:hypothetical protein IMSHALPRED_001694 [Imshaugia aleurites]|uniref:Uncharacterized protein n=1 Tax=Imshaugia aleurites TaxID=172621 RepID=A0A8H3J3D1_9LECA|nr:hypothetical protein IMSHALPRED_001694 [Imshaugia aleurites]
MAEIYYLPRKTFVDRTDDRAHRDAEKSPSLSLDSAQRIARRKAASNQLRGKLRTAFRGTSPRPEGAAQRRVTFQTPPPKRELSESHRHLRQRERPRSGRAGDVTALDHQIAIHGGTTSTIECLPHRLRITKVQQTSGPQQRIEELVRDVGHLNQELSYYKDTRKVLMKLFDSVKASHETLQAAVAEADRDLAISEQRYVRYWVPYYDDHTIEENIF